MHPNIKILKLAADAIGIPYSGVSGFPDALFISKYWFVRSGTPFNNESLSMFCRDKDAVYKMLQGIVPIPKYKSFLDPDGKYPTLVKEKSLDEIACNSLDFIYPCIVKMNQGEGSRNVHIVNSDFEKKHAFSLIFNKQSRNYDYLGIIQDYVEPKREFRAIISSGMFEFVYDRFTKEVIRTGIEKQIEKPCVEILKKIPLVWGAIDFIESKDGKLFFLEINTRPEWSEEFSISEQELLLVIYKRTLTGFIHQ